MVLAGFGLTISVEGFYSGRNIAGSTRMIPVIALEMDGLGLARGLGFILTAITMLVLRCSQMIQSRPKKRR